ncbi:MAG: TPM domain-containing protein [Flavobacteriaceae bacterium]|nr:TPM domain-containing protein [Flavobacteriaceae bacterium]
MKTKKFFFSVIILFSLLSNATFAQLNIPPKPAKQTSVYDEVGILSTSEKSNLEQKLIQYSDSTSTQIVVSIIPTLNGEEIAMFATEWAHQWGIGQAKEDNGIFLLVVTDDRKLTIRTGYGVEHLLTDALSKRIISQIIAPEFKSGNYFMGIDKGTDAIFQVLKGEYKNQPEKKQRESNPPIFLIILIILMVIIAFSSKNNKRDPFNNKGNKNSSTADTLLTAILLSSLGRSSGGGSGGFGSSGDGGFGGGGFGGGGASGGW